MIDKQKVKGIKTYHFFIALALLNFLLYYLFLGKSVLDVHDLNIDAWKSESFFYSVIVSVLLLIIWFSYFVSRNKLKEHKWIWIHWAFSFFIIVFVPGLYTIFFPAMPRRYYDYGDEHSFQKLLGSYFYPFLFVVFFLIASEIFFFINLKPQKNSNKD